MSDTMTRNQQRGYSFLELLAAIGVFSLFAGAAFALLNRSQQSFQGESQVMNSFQEAQLGLDQIVRDVNDAGFPPQNTFAIKAANNANNYTVTPFAWNPGYPLLPACTIGGICVTPANFDLIVETNISPQTTNNVSWVRYQLQGTTLCRGVVTRVPGNDPVATTNPVMIPYIQNVMNNATAAQIAQFQADYPTMFPGGNPVPIFTYTCDVGGANPPAPCPAAGAANSPLNIRDVDISLIVMAPQPDSQTGTPRLVALTGRAHRLNPNQ